MIVIGDFNTNVRSNSNMQAGTKLKEVVSSLKYFDFGIHFLCEPIALDLIITNTPNKILTYGQIPVT